MSFEQKKLVSIDANSYLSPNYNERTRFLVLHYTAASFKSAMETRFLKKNEVSVGYLVPDPADKTYRAAGYEDLRVFKLLPEDKRSWHAGASAWEDRVNLNDSSIAVDFVNLASDNHGVFTFPPFNEQQIEAGIAVCRNILERYPDITPTRVLGHGDISLDRKSDMGTAFPWKKLYENGIGAWYAPEVKKKWLEKFTREGIPTNDNCAKYLSIYGYGIQIVSKGYVFKQFLTRNYCLDPTPVKDVLKKTVRVFQLHFRPEKYDGVIDVETAAILYALVEKYFPKQLVK